MRRLLPTPADDVDVNEEYAVAAGAPWLRANMVSTIDGSVTDGAGLSGGISGEPDRRVFRVLRSLADAIVVGARTALAEGYRRTAVPLVVLSRTLDVDLATPMLGEAEAGRSGLVIVVSPRSAPPDRRAKLLAHADRVGGIELLTAGDDELDLAAALASLRARGLAHLLCEGGPALLASLIHEALLDELCVTTSPIVVGGSGQRILSGPPILTPTDWHSAGLYEDETFLFARWVHPR